MNSVSFCTKMCEGTFRGVTRLVSKQNQTVFETNVCTFLCKNLCRLVLEVQGMQFNELGFGRLCEREAHASPENSPSKVAQVVCTGCDQRAPKVSPVDYFEGENSNQVKREGTGRCDSTHTATTRAVPPPKYWSEKAPSHRAHQD